MGNHDQKIDEFISYLEHQENKATTYQSHVTIKQIKYKFLEIFKGYKYDPYSKIRQ
jgi:hypothetical protein